MADAEKVTVTVEEIREVVKEEIRLTLSREEALAAFLALGSVAGSTSGPRRLVDTTLAALERSGLFPTAGQDGALDWDETYGYAEDVLGAQTDGTVTLNSN